MNFPQLWLFDAVQRDSTRVGDCRSSLTLLTHSSAMQVVCRKPPRLA